MLLAWGAKFSAIHIDLFFRVYLLDLVVIFFLFVSALKISVNPASGRRLRYYVVFCIAILLLGAYALVVMRNPFNAVAGQVRVYVLYSALLVTTYYTFDRPQDLNMLMTVLRLSLYTLLGLGLFRIVTHTGYAYKEFAANVDDVTRYFSPPEAAVMSFFYYLFLVKLIKRGGVKQIRDLVLASAVLLALLISNYRSIWLSVVLVSAIFMASTLVRRRRRNLRGAFILLSVGIVFAAFVATYYSGFIARKFYGVNFSGAVQGREIMWLEALGRIFQHPVLGSGIGFFRLFQGHIATLHNDLLQIAQNFGLVGSLAILTTIVMLVRRKTSDYADSVWKKKYADFRTALGLTLGGILVVSFFEPFLLQPATFAVVFAMLGFVIKYDRILLRARTAELFKGTQ